MKKEISLKISSISFVMTYIVVLYHCKYYTGLFWGEVDKKIYYFSINVIECLTSMALGYFFAVTGYFMYRKMNLSNVKDKIRKRVFSLAVPYTLWNGIYLIDKIIQGDKYKFGKIAFDFAFRPFCTPLWYVLIIFVLALLAPVLLRILKNKKRAIFFLIGVYVLSYYATVTRYNELIRFTDVGWYWERLIRYLPSYFTGAVVGLHFENVVEKQNKKIVVLSAILFVISIVLVGQNKISDGLIWTINRFQPFLLWIMILPPKKEVPEKIKILFGSSFIVYVMHMFVLKKYNDLSQIYQLKPDKLHGIETIIFRVAISLGVTIMSIIIWWILKKISPKTLKFLTGGRE